MGMPNAFGLHPVAADDGAAVPVALHDSRGAALLKAPRDLTAAPVEAFIRLTNFSFGLLYPHRSQYLIFDSHGGARSKRGCDGETDQTRNSAQSKGW